MTKVITAEFVVYESMVNAPRIFILSIPPNKGILPAIYKQKHSYYAIKMLR